MAACTNNRRLSAQHKFGLNQTNRKDDRQCGQHAEQEQHAEGASNGAFRKSCLEWSITCRSALRLPIDDIRMHSW